MRGCLARAFDFAAVLQCVAPQLWLRSLIPTAQDRSWDCDSTEFSGVVGRVLSGRGLVPSLGLDIIPVIWDGGGSGGCLFPLLTKCSFLGKSGHYFSRGS